MGAIRTGRTARRLAAAMIVSGVVVTTTGVLPAAAAPALTIERITFNVIGLDSNDVTTGPNTFPVGVRVCNTGTDAATNLDVTLVWDSTNQFIDVDSSTTRTRDELAAGSCTDVQWQAVVERDPAAHDTTRRYHITASADGVAPVSTPTPRELYVEKLISQNRNQVLQISGANELTVGETLALTLDASTAPGGYEQLETYLDLPSSIFEFVSVDVDYGAPTGATNDTVYADACGWDHDPTSATYRSCVGPEQYPGGKAGGDMQLRYTVRAVGAGTANLSGVIFDQSGASYHYNADYGREPNLFSVTVLEPPPAPAPPDPPAPAAPADDPAPAEPVAEDAAPAVDDSTADTLPRTGQDSGRLGLFGLSLVAAGAGLVLLVAPRRRDGSDGDALGRLTVASDRLRSSVEHHAADPAASTARRLLVALDAVAAALRP